MLIGRQNSSRLRSVVRGELALFVPSRVEQPSAVFCSARGLFSFRFLCFSRLPIVVVIGFAILGSFPAATFDVLLFFYVFPDLPRKRSPKKDAKYYIHSKYFSIQNSQSC